MDDHGALQNEKSRLVAEFRQVEAQKDRAVAAAMARAQKSGNFLSSDPEVTALQNQMNAIASRISEVDRKLD